MFDSTLSHLKALRAHLGRPQPARPQDDYGLFALRPDPSDLTMLKATLPPRRRRDPLVPAVVTASVSRKILRARPRQAPVIFVKGQPDWRRGLLDMLDRFERGAS